MSLKKVKKYLLAHVIARVVYLFSATIICVGMILDVIMIVNVLLPYLRVAGYVTTTCAQNTTIIYNMDDNSNTPLANTTIRPCIQVTVDFNYTNSAGRLVKITTLLKNDEYNVLDNYICSYTTYMPFYWQNEREVFHFDRNYGQPDSTYYCFYDPNNPDRVISHKANTQFSVMHSLLWPSLAIALGIILVVFFYMWVGCDIWGTRIATVMWDKSLKRIEMEQEIKRRTNNNFHKKSWNSFA